MTCANCGRCLLRWATPAATVFAGVGLIISACQIQDARNVNAAAVSTKLTTYTTEEIRSFKEVKTEPERVISDLYVLQLNHEHRTIEDPYYNLVGQRWCKAIADDAVICDYWNNNYTAFKDADFRSFVASVLRGKLCSKTTRSDTCRDLKY
jgi:hypothetical protein